MLWGFQVHRKQHCLSSYGLKAFLQAFGFQSHYIMFSNPSNPYVTNGCSLLVCNAFHLLSAHTLSRDQAMKDILFPSCLGARFRRRTESTKVNTVIPFPVVESWLSVSFATKLISLVMVQTVESPLHKSKSFQHLSNSFDEWTRCCCNDDVVQHRDFRGRYVFLPATRSLRPSILEEAWRTSISLGRCLWQGRCFTIEQPS